MPPKTNSGIQKLKDGNSVIPSSVRADGSVRKEIRVKAGYKPPEDVEVYKNRTAEAWKNRGKGGVPGAQVVGADEGAAKAASNKNAKRREARRKAAAAGGTEEGKDARDEEQKVNANGNGVQGSATVADVKEAEEVDPEAEKAKEARKLAKKLRQARELREKKEQGGSLLPEQLAKAVKVSELIRQLDGLGFDHEGEKISTNGRDAKEG